MNELLSSTREALTKTGNESSDFDLNKNVVLPKDRKLRPAAVLAPIILGQNGYDLILTKRSSALKHHPGQIAFPGGKKEKTDEQKSRKKFTT